MSESPIYGTEELPTNPGPNAGPVVNDMNAANERAVNSVKSWTITTDTLPTNQQMAEGYIHILGGTPAADFTFGVEALARRFKVRNQSGKIATIQVVGGAGKKVVITDLNEADIQCDGTDCVVSGRTTVMKSADQSVNTDATVNSDLSLQFRMEASTTYAVKGVIFFSTAATPDFKFTFSAPASPTLVRFARHQAGGGDTPAEVVLDSAYPADAAIVGGGAEGYLEFEGIIQNGVNAGNFIFQWSQNTSDGSSTTLRKGSRLEYCRQ